MQDLIKIAGTEITRITYRGEQVVTFEQVDKVHQRPQGTAKGSFDRNRDRFIEGEDFVLVTASQKDVLRTFGIDVPNRGLTLFTERGYLKMVKPMNDDKAWEVFGEMIDRYFAVEQAVEKVADAPSITDLTEYAREVQNTFAFYQDLCDKAQITGNQAFLAASRATEKTIGISPMLAIGVTHLNAPKNEALLTVSDIAERLGGGATARKVNVQLAANGYQVAHRDAKDRIYYEPTEKGIAAGATMQHTGKKHSDGTLVTQLKWSSRIVDELQNEDA